MDMFSKLLNSTKQVHLTILLKIPNHRSDYLLLKVEIRPDGIAVSGGRKLRSVPARQAAQSELKQADDPEHPATTQPEVRIMFGLRRISTQRSDQHGHSIREGKGHIMLM
jgi:hypothetical protein